MSTLSVALLSLLWVTSTRARPNTHGLLISSWDQRASSLTFGFHSAVAGDFQFSDWSAGANFSSSGGLLSAQFGVHYLSFQEGDQEAPDALGGAIGGAALLHFPIGPRQPGTLSATALDIYLGGMPTALVGVTRNYLSLPLAIGAGFTWSPSQWVSFTPWVELSRSINLDPSLQEVDTQGAVDSAADGELTREEVEELVKEAFPLNDTSETATRFGINGSLHLSPRFDLDVDLFWGAGGVSTAGLGASLVFRWGAFTPTQRAPGPQPAKPANSTPHKESPPAFARPSRRRPAPSAPAPARRRVPRFRQIPVPPSQSAPPQTKGSPAKSTSPPTRSSSGRTQQAALRGRSRIRAIPQQ